MLEVEVKLRANIKDVENSLKQLNFTRMSSVYELDVYYNSEHKNLKAEDKALRIREHRDLDSGEAHFLMNFKGPKIDRISMSRKEVEFEVPSFAEGETLFKGLGFYPTGRVEKTRIYYGKNEITCCLDLVTGLGEFLEIEVLAENQDGYEEAMAKIKMLLGELGLQMEDSIRRSYLSMLMNSRRSSCGDLARDFGQLR